MRIEKCCGTVGVTQFVDLFHSIKANLGYCVYGNDKEWIVQFRLDAAIDVINHSDDNDKVVIRRLRWNRREGRNVCKYPNTTRKLFHSSYRNGKYKRQVISLRIPLIIEWEEIIKWNRYYVVPKTLQGIAINEASRIISYSSIYKTPIFSWISFSISILHFSCKCCYWK